MNFCRSRHCKFNLLTFIEIVLFLLVGLLLIQTCVSQDATQSDTSNSNTGTDKKPDSSGDGASKLEDASSGNTNLNTDSSVTESTSNTNTNTDTNRQDSVTDTSQASDQKTLKDASTSTGTSSGTFGEIKAGTLTNEAAGTTTGVSTDQDSEQTIPGTQSFSTDISISSKDMVQNDASSTNVSKGIDLTSKTDSVNVDTLSTGDVKVIDTSSATNSSSHTNSQTVSQNVNTESTSETGDTGIIQGSNDFPPPPPPPFFPPPPPPPQAFNQNQDATSTFTNDAGLEGNIGIKTSSISEPKDSSLALDNNVQAPLSPPELQAEESINTTKDQNTKGSVINDIQQPTPGTPQTNTSNNMPPPPPDASFFPPPPPSFENTDLNQNIQTKVSETNSTNDIHPMLVTSKTGITNEVAPLQTLQNDSTSDIQIPQEMPQNSGIQPRANVSDNQPLVDSKTETTSNVSTKSNTISVSSQFPPPPPPPPPPPSFGSADSDQSTVINDNNVNQPGSNLPVTESAVNTSLTSSSSIQAANLQSSNKTSNTSVGNPSLSVLNDTQEIPPPPPPGLDLNGQDITATFDDVPPPPPPPPSPRNGSHIISKEPSPIDIPMVPPPPPPTDGSIDNSLSQGAFPDLPIVPPPPPTFSTLQSGSADISSGTNTVGNSSLQKPTQTIDDIRNQNVDAGVPQELRNIMNTVDKNEKSPVSTSIVGAASEIGTANLIDPSSLFPPPRPDSFEMGPPPPPPPPPAPPSFELTGVSTTPEPMSTATPVKSKVTPIEDKHLPPPPPPSEALAPKPRYVEKQPEIVVTLTHPAFKPIQPPSNPSSNTNNQNADYSIQDLFRLRQPGMPSPFTNTNWIEPKIDTPTQEERLQNILFSNQYNTVPHPQNQQNFLPTNTDVKAGVFTRPMEKPDPLLSLLQPGMPLPSLDKSWQQSNVNDQTMTQRLTGILFGNQNIESPHPLGELKQSDNFNSFSNTNVRENPRTDFQRQDSINWPTSSQLPDDRFNQYNINHQIKSPEPVNRLGINTSPPFSSESITREKPNSVGNFNPLDPNYLFGNNNEKEFFDYWTNKAFMGNPVPQNSQNTRLSFSNQKPDFPQRSTLNTQPEITTRSIPLNEVLHNRQNGKSGQGEIMTATDLFRNRHLGNTQGPPTLPQPRDINTNTNKDPQIAATRFHLPNQNINDNLASANHWDISKFSNENFNDKKFQNFRIGPVTVTATDSFSKPGQDGQTVSINQGSSSNQVNKFQTGIRGNPYLFSHQNNFDTHTTVNPQQINVQSFTNPSTDVNFLTTQFGTTEKPKLSERFNPDAWWTDPLVSNSWQNTRSNDGILFMPGTAAYKSQPPVEMKDIAAPKIPKFMEHLLPFPPVSTSNNQDFSPLVNPKTITPPTTVNSAVQVPAKHGSFETGSKSFTPHPLMTGTRQSGSNLNFLSKNQDAFGSRSTISSQPIDTPENQKNWEKLVFSMILPNNKNNWEPNIQNSNFDQSKWDSNTGLSDLYLTQKNNFDSTNLGASGNMDNDKWAFREQQTNSNPITQENQWISGFHQNIRIQQPSTTGSNTHEQSSWNQNSQQNSNRQQANVADFGRRGSSFSSIPKTTKSWSELLNSAVESKAPETSAYGWPELLHIKNNHAVDAAVGKEFSSIPKEAPPPVPTNMREPVIDLSKVVGSTMPPVTSPMTIEIQTVPGLVTDTENGIIFKPKTNGPHTETYKPPVTNAPPIVLVTQKPVVAKTTKFPENPPNEILKPPPIPGDNITLTEPKTLDNVEHMRELLFPLEICKKCVYINDYCYLQDNETCNRFVMCFKQGTIVRAFQKECAYGQFWNFTAISCQAASRVDCPLDPCKNFSVRSYPYEGKCKAYWTCRRGRSDARCCPKGYAYNSKGMRAGCRADNKCKTECSPAEKEVKNPECPLHASSSKFHFLEAGIRKPCAPGTMFNLTACTCVMAKETPPPQPAPVCDASLSLDFNGNSKETAFRDRSTKRQTFAIYHVYPKANTAMFYGDSRITLWRYSNLQMGSQFALRLRFYAHGGRQRPQVLLANCEGAGGYQDSTVEIRLNSITHEITFKLSTLERPNNVILMTYKPFRWYELVYVYDGDMFAAGLDGKIESVFVHGLIKNRHSSIVIGGCQNRDGFKGYMDDIRFYDGCIPDDIEAMI